MPNSKNSTSSLSTTVISSIRRKPKITYQSPSADVPATLRIEGPRPSFSRTISSRYGSSSSSPKPISMPPPPSTVRPVSSGKGTAHSARKRDKFATGSSLPLYHPLGRLALSLPELDPSTIGLSAPLVVDDANRRSSGRARRPAAKVRDADETNDSISQATNANTSTLEAKEKQSPRRRRNGGGGNKRKRREGDDGDATYPAKRTRNPRGAVAAPTSTTARTPTSDISPPQSVVRATGSPSVADSAAEAPEEKKPERRTTRSRGALLRRDSSASEATVTSVSVSVAARQKNEETTEADKPNELPAAEPADGGVKVQVASTRTSLDKGDEAIGQDAESKEEHSGQRKE